MGAELGPLTPQATTSIVWLSALDTRQVFPLPVSSQAFACLSLSWRLNQSTQVLNIHHYLVSEASFFLLKLYVPQIPEGDTFS